MAWTAVPVSGGAGDCRDKETGSGERSGADADASMHDAGRTLWWCSESTKDVGGMPFWGDGI